MREEKLVEIPEQMDFMVTAKCNARCNMCVQEVTAKLLDSDDVFEEGIRKHLNWYYRAGGRRVVITGGEPTLAMGRVLTSLDILSDYPDMDLVTIYTNSSRLMRTEEGSNKTNLERMVSKGLKYVNQSVHHFDAEKNSEVFKIFIPDPKITAAYMRSFGVPFRYNATLQRGCLETSEDVLRYLDFAKEQRATDVYLRELFGFVNQNPTSPRGRIAVEYSKTHKVSVEPIIEELENRGATRVEERKNFQGRNKKEIKFVASNGLPFYIASLDIGDEDPTRFPYFVVMPDGHLYSTWLGTEYRVDPFQTDIIGSVIPVSKRIV